MLNPILSDLIHLCICLKVSPFCSAMREGWRTGPPTRSCLHDLSALLLWCCVPHIMLFADVPGKGEKEREGECFLWHWLLGVVIIESVTNSLYTICCHVRLFCLERVTVTRFVREVCRFILVFTVWRVSSAGWRWIHLPGWGRNCYINRCRHRRRQSPSCSRHRFLGWLLSTKTDVFNYGFPNLFFWHLKFLATSNTFFQPLDCSHQSKCSSQIFLHYILHSILTESEKIQFVASWKNIFISNFFKIKFKLWGISEALN